MVSPGLPGLPTFSLSWAPALGEGHGPAAWVHRVELSGHRGCTWEKRNAGGCEPEASTERDLDSLRGLIVWSSAQMRPSWRGRILDEEVAALLEIDVTQPVLLVGLLVSDMAPHPVEIADTFYRADRYRFEVEMPMLPGRRARRDAGGVARRRPAPAAPLTLVKSIVRIEPLAVATATGTPLTGGHDGYGPLR